MLKKIAQIASVLLASSVASTALFALDSTVKSSMRANSRVAYHILPSQVNNFSELFSEGLFYGRARTNNFYYSNSIDKDKQHLASGVGGSLLYKSAQLSGFDFGVGFYYSKAFFSADKHDVGMLTKGKDILSRHDYVNTGSTSMGVLGQAYIRFTQDEIFDITLGRQIVESFYTKSNDTKMIPNTFDGVVVNAQVIPDTKVKLAYLWAQKLRDHTQTNSLLLYGDANSTDTKFAKWSENDDSAMHRGLTYTALKAAGKPTDAPLIMGDIKNRSIHNLKADLSFYVVAKLISQVMGELNYKIELGNGLSITPAVRYVQQFDNGAGEVGGASFKGNVNSINAGGYKDPNSLNSAMIGARAIVRYENYRLNIAYTNVLDKADLVTPWRGFATSGYTRSMARYNWRANTKSYRVELQRNMNKEGVFKDIYTQASVLYTDADQAKGVSDEIYYYLGFMQNIPALVNMQWRLRLGYACYSKSQDFNAVDARAEINYMF